MCRLFYELHCCYRILKVSRSAWALNAKRWENFANFWPKSLCITETVLDRPIILWIASGKSWEDNQSVLISVTSSDLGRLDVRGQIIPVDLNKFARIILPDQPNVTCGRGMLIAHAPGGSLTPHPKGWVPSIPNFCDVSTPIWFDIDWPNLAQ